MPNRIANLRIGTPFPGDNAPAVRYYLEDHLGNCSFTLETSGALFSREEYFPFGETSFGSFAKKRYRFCGKERDEESGLYYYGARYYAAWTCRFVSVDPLAGEYPFYTPYSGMANNPIVFIDIDGNEPIPSTDVKQNEDGSYTIVNAQNDGDSKIYIVNDDGIRTGEVIGRTITPYDFMSTGKTTDDLVFKKEEGLFSAYNINFRLEEMTVDVHLISDNGIKYDGENLDGFKLIQLGEKIFQDNLNILEENETILQIKNLTTISSKKQILDFKYSLKYPMYTPIEVGKKDNGSYIITPLRAIGNITFGENLRDCKPFFKSEEEFFDFTAKFFGLYNIMENKRPMSDFKKPFWGEDFYSGSFIYLGYFHKIYDEK